MNSGVYTIRCKVNNKIYVGSSSDMISRFQNHKTELRRGKHYNAALQSDYNIYGESSFEFVHDQKIRNKNTYRRVEGRLIRKYKSYGLAYNVAQQTIRFLSKCKDTPFQTLMLVLWGERWRKPFDALLAQHGHKYSRHTVWCWQVGKRPVRESVMVIINEEAKRRGL